MLSRRRRRHRVRQRGQDSPAVRHDLVDCRPWERPRGFVVPDLKRAGSDLVDAREKAYDGVELIQLEGAQFRTDIAGKAARGEIHVPYGATGSIPKVQA